MYPATLLNSFLHCNIFVDSLGLSEMTITIAIKNSFISSYLTCMSFILVSSLIILARISSIILNWSGKRGHPCFVSDLRQKAFSFFTISIMLLGWGSPLTFLVGWDALSLVDIEFFQVLFFASVEMIMFFLVI